MLLNSIIWAAAASAAAAADVDVATDAAAAAARNDVGGSMDGMILERYARKNLFSERDSDDNSSPIL